MILLIAKDYNKVVHYTLCNKYSWKHYKMAGEISNINI